MTRNIGTNTMFSKIPIQNSINPTMRATNQVIKHVKLIGEQYYKLVLFST